MQTDQDAEDPDEEVEHRVRVHELLQYACCLNLEGYSTAHGLQQHLRDYHDAVEAVEQNSCPDLLQLETVQRFLTTRLEHERQQMPQVMALPPDMLLGIAEQIEPLIWHGHSKLLYKKRDLRLQLTIQCQLCGQRFDSGDKLNHHLHAVHPESLQEVQNLKHLFPWSMFAELGCFCNPGPGWGAMHHECVGLTQLALLAASFNWQVVVPWPFSSAQLTDLLSVLLPDDAMQRIAMALMTRNFHTIWQDPALIQMLRTRCLLCQEEVELKTLKAHLFVFHRITGDRVAYLAEQLSVVYAALQSPDWHCDWCNEVLPSYEEDYDIQTCPIEHLKYCPFVIQMALLLMMPVWTKPALTPFVWPTHEAIRAAQRQEELRLWQYNVFVEQLRRTMNAGDLNFPTLSTSSGAP